MSENDTRTMILKMLAEGKITVEESERLLNAVNQEKASKQSQSKAEGNSKDNGSFPNIPFLEVTKFGAEIKNIAQNMHTTIQKTIKQVEPKSKDIKEKMREFGAWMEDMVETVASEITNHSGLPADSMSVDFIVPAPMGTENCKTYVIENIYGEVNIEEGNEFKLLVKGQISKNTLGEMQSSEWFSNSAIKIIDDEMHIGFDANTSIKALIDLNLTLPSNVRIICKTINSNIKTKGHLTLDSLETVSGNIKIDRAAINNTFIETVSGVIQVENADKINTEINTTSGDLIVNNSNIKKLSIKSVSGDFILSSSEVALGSEINAVTTSGDITIEKINGPWKRIDAVTRSGEVLIDWKGNTAPVTNQKTTITSGGEGAVFSATSVSGDIKFR